MVQRDAAARDQTLPVKLADSYNLAKFVRSVLPNILSDMREKYDWADTPRVVVHDKASYMVSTGQDRLQATFAGALQEAGLKSWVGDSTRF